MESHAQNSGIYSQKSDSNHYFGVDSTIIWEWIPNRTPKEWIFHSTALLKRVDESKGQATFGIQRDATQCNVNGVASRRMLNVAWPLSS